jgi:signal peptidase II
MFWRLLLLLVLDQLSKQIFYGFNQSYWLIGNQLGFSLQLNDGVAFSFPVSSTVTIPIGIVVTFVFLFLYMEYFKRTKLVYWTVGLLLAGTLGNLIDRVFLGSVIDFVKIFAWPTFNLADCYLVLDCSFFSMIVWRNVIKFGLT